MLGAARRARAGALGKKGGGGPSRRGELFGTVWRPEKDKEMTSETPRLDGRVQCVEWQQQYWVASGAQPAVTDPSRV